MYRTFVIIRHTFLEAIFQPIFSLMLAIGAGVLIVFTLLPFFTLGEDTKMFMAVGLDIILLLVLISTLFATSKSIFEEIEDRTMLTLMSKPVYKWEVLVGKYLGIVLSALLAMVLLGALMCLCLAWRIPGDYMLHTNTPDDREVTQIFNYRLMHIYGLVFSLFLSWLQICVLAAVGVALSTRFSLVVNLPTVIIVYIAGNLTRFLFPGGGQEGVLAGRSFLVKGIAYLTSLVIPYLAIFDLRQLTVYKTIRIGEIFSQDTQGVDPSTIWKYAGVAVIYCIAYTTFSLSAGMYLFQTRELGGGEG